MPRYDKLTRFLDASSEDSNMNVANNRNRITKQEKQPETKTSEISFNLKSRVRKAKYSLEDYVFPTEKCERQFKRILSEMENHNLIYTVWGMGEKHSTDIGQSINLIGPSGTGKSMLHEVFAHTVNLKILDVPSTASKYVGETEKLIQEIFSFAKNNNLFILWNEADRDFGKRLEQVNQSADASINSARDILLEELSSYKGIIGLTTNLVKNYDASFLSRIRYQMKLELPDTDARAKIWQVQISNKLPLDQSVNFMELARKFDQISGRDIKKAVLNAVVTAASENKSDIEKSVKQFHFIEAMEEIIAIKQETDKTEIQLTPVEGKVDLPPNPNESNI